MRLTDSEDVPNLPQIQMRRPNFQELPAMPPIPDGYALRLATQRDSLSLAKLMARTFEDASWTAERAERELLHDPNCKGTWVIVQGEDVVATATALLSPDHQPGTGIVHWVASDSNHRGKKLGTIVCVAVLQAFQKMGCKDSTLLTDDARLPAIKTYLNLGFEPDYTHESHQMRWSEIAHKLTE